MASYLLVEFSEENEKIGQQLISCLFKKNKPAIHEKGCPDKLKCTDFIARVVQLGILFR